ncbi:MAG: hypothetical protein WB772_02060 [Xanthobacteraceae bacterium]
MPTVLDFLRRQLLGDDTADKLELCLDIVNARVFDGWQHKIPAQDNDSPVIDIAALSKPSPGYEPLLMRMGCDQFTARGLANFAVRRGRQQARESKVCAQVRKDIRFLARGSRRRDAIIRCARRLHDAWENNRIVGDLLFHANVDDFKFWLLLKSVSQGDLSQIQRVFEIAAKAAPRLFAKRGPKIAAPSATHEFFLSDKLGIVRTPCTNIRGGIMIERDLRAGTKLWLTGWTKTIAGGGYVSLLVEVADKDGRPCR